MPPHKLGRLRSSIRLTPYPNHHLRLSGLYSVVYRYDTPNGRHCAILKSEDGLLTIGFCDSDELDTALHDEYDDVIDTMRERKLDLETLRTRYQEANPQ